MCLLNERMQSVLQSALQDFPSDKEYVIYISTPSIPDNEQVSYGISNVKKHFFKENKRSATLHFPESGFIVTIIYIIIC